MNKTQKSEDQSKIQENLDKDEDSPIFFINVFLNLLITVALAISIYLLISNLVLVVYNIRQTYAANISTSNEDYSNQFNKKQLVDILETQRAFYDCSETILNSEDKLYCNKFNSYYIEYINSKSSSSSNIKANKQISFLKLDTKYYVQ